MSTAPATKLIARGAGLALPLLNPRDDAARLIAVMAREHQPLTLAELAPRAGIPIAETRLALGRLKRLGLLDGSAADGWTLRRAAAEAAPAVEIGVRALAYLRDQPEAWHRTRDIEHAIDAGDSQLLYTLGRLTQIGEVERRPRPPRGYEWRAVVTDREP